ncbi:Hint domain-containing protein [Roseovarius autotrophicus]|uniref:Hint domain-containing protein n=1 Tax=Roseovarius autotrophicus TaxID=2824121 RepID=UPI0019DB0FB7|nr:Hint domain-containing protein [Roseovarius autotrophicus]MBE0452048.1 Hint domain-containing protein [Roseovarius sp.]
MTAPKTRPAQSILVHEADDLRVVNGANLGDALSFADELDLDDIYELGLRSRTRRLALVMDGEGPFTIGEGSELGIPGAPVHLDARLTLMPASGNVVELLIFVETDGEGCVSATYAMPLADLSPRLGYALVGIDRAGARQRFAQAACVSFTRGTRITMATGAQVPVEDLHPGDMVLTRDDGPQPLRWIGQNTMRAVGEFAPVRISAGTLNNSDDLLVSPDHRLFIYQRDDTIGAGHREVLVRARHLVNDDSVRVETGGHVDYVQLLFDRHQIIYAEGIAAETLLLDPRTRPALPEEGHSGIASRVEHDTRTHLQFEISRALLDHPNAAELLKRASTR